MMREFKIVGQLKKTNKQKNRPVWIELMADLLTNSVFSKNYENFYFVTPHSHWSVSTLDGGRN